MAVAVVAVATTTTDAPISGATAGATTSGRRNLPREGWSSICRPWAVAYKGAQLKSQRRWAQERGGGGRSSSSLRIQGQSLRTPVPLVNIVEPDVNNSDDDDNDDSDDNNDDEGTVLRGGGDHKRMGFQGGCKEEKGNGGRFDSAGGRWGDRWQTCEDVVLYWGWSLIDVTGIKYEQYTCIGIINSMIPHPK
jgi:hypothetical protein